VFRGKGFESPERIDKIEAAEPIAGPGPRGGRKTGAGAARRSTNVTGRANLRKSPTPIDRDERDGESEDRHRPPFYELL